PPPPTSTLFPYTTLFRSATLQSFASLDIVGQHHSKLLSSRPSRPSFRCLSRTRADRPRACEPPFPSPRRPSAQSDSKRPRQKRRSEEHTSELQSRGHLVC